MNLETLTTFFMWCTILNGGVLVFWALFLICAPEFIFRMHSKWFPMSRETYNAVVYGFLGAAKIVFVAFNAVPYVALSIVG